MRPGVFRPTSRVTLSLSKRRRSVTIALAGDSLLRFAAFFRTKSFEQTGAPSDFSTHLRPDRHQNDYYHFERLDLLRCSSSDKGCKSRRRLRARDFSSCLCRVPRTRTSHASGSRLSERRSRDLLSAPGLTRPQKNNRYQAVSI